MSQKDSLYRCNKCKCSFKSVGFLKDHQFNRNKCCIYRPSEDSPFSCLFCDQTFPNGLAIYKHYVRQHTLYGPNSIPLEANQHPQGKTYIDYAKDLLSPSLANMALGCREDAKNIQLKWAVNDTTSTNKAVFRCEACDFASADAESMAAHRWSHSVEGEIEEKLKRPTIFGGQKPYQRPTELYSKFFRVFSTERRAKAKQGARVKSTSTAAGAQEEGETNAQIGRRSAREALGRKLTLLRSAHDGGLKLFRYIFPETVNFPDSAFVDVSEEVIRILTNEIAVNKGRAIKFSLALVIELIKIDEFLNIQDEIVVPFRSNMFLLQTPRREEMMAMLAESKEKIESSIDTFVKRGSGWTIRQVKHLILHALFFTQSSSSFLTPPL